MLQGRTKHVSTRVVDETELVLSVHVSRKRKLRKRGHILEVIHIALEGVLNLAYATH